MSNRNNEVCIVCHKKMRQGSSGSWCPDQHKMDQQPTHYYNIEHDQAGNVIGRKLVEGFPFMFEMMERQ